MATIDDLGYQSISELPHEEGLLLIQQIRANRRIVKRKTKPKSALKKAPELTPEQAEEALKILGGIT